LGYVDDAELTNRIKDVFIRVLDLPLNRDQLADGMSLYSPVIQMDSLALLNLLVAFEEDFGVEIDDEDVMNANFTTVASVVEMIGQVIETSVEARGGEKGRIDTPGRD
jgi:acyl carrier protein